MAKMKLIDIIGTPAAISPRTGQKAYDFVSGLLKDSKSVVISFRDITDCTSAFCNSFFGKLYMTFDPQQVDTLVQIEDLDEHGLWLKKIHNAKLLGTNENVRTDRKANLADLILS